jgi:CBS domain-containing protein
MTKPVISLDARNIKYAVRLLFRFGLSRALVLEQGELIGIVTSASSSSARSVDRANLAGLGRKGGLAVRRHEAA